MQSLKLKQTTGFDSHFVAWVQAACKEWSYPEPSEPYYEKVFARLPEGLRTLLGNGITEGLIISEGDSFSLKGLQEGKGPYHWFTRNPSKKEPSVNWEYLVQVAEFVRLFRIANVRNMILNFEDDLMDLALYEGERLVVCCEVKERADQMEELIRGIEEHQEGVNFTKPDRGNDPLRKAKYIVKRRPQYFCGVAIGTRFEYRVHYPREGAFSMSRDVIPWI